MSDGLPQVGTKSAAWLRQVGVRSRADLERLGALEAFLRVKRAGFRPSLNLLWALEGALLRCHWTAVPEARRLELRQALAEAEARLAAARAHGGAGGALPSPSGAGADEDPDSFESPGSAFDEPETDPD
ncbi:MAG: TfoX/Sxy family protein [Xanthomonadales bacterium]|nr:TfoX/Sxy family protein [Xanthomonadales bacterium]